MWQSSYPVVGEVLVHYLSHLCLLALEDVGGEVEDDVEHGRLGGQGHAAVLGVGIDGDLGGREGGEGGREGERVRGGGEGGGGREGGGEGERRGRGRGREEERGGEGEWEGERGRGGGEGGGREGGKRLQLTLGITSHCSSKLHAYMYMYTPS